MMQSLKSSTKSRRYTIPTGYGIICDERYDYLVMEYLEGPTIWEAIGNGAQELLEDCANEIVAAVQDLRQSRQLCNTLLKSNALTPLVHWHPQSPIFGFDNDGGRVLDRMDFIGFMTVRFKAAGVNLNAVPLAPSVITHGELSPHNLKLCPDGTIGIMDLRTTFLAPVWWEYYALHVAHDSPKYTDPLMRAMIRYGMSASNETIFELDNKFIPWFARLGGAWARKERKEIEARSKN